MPILIIAEHDNTILKSATRCLVTAAQKLGQDVHILVMGSSVQKVGEAASEIPGVTKVLVADHPAFKNFLAENLTPVIAEKARGYSHVMAPATTFGKNVMPRVAALLDVAQISDVIAVVDDKTFQRPIYAGNGIATVETNDPIKVLTVRPSAFEAAAATGGKAVVETVTEGSDAGLSRFVGQEISISTRPELAGARIVVSGGRGLQTKENFKLIEDLADVLKAAVGASRAAVDAGLVPNDYQVGQTGKIVAPELYIGIGISGAIQHLAGMKDSKVIVAINKDPEAPLMQIADYALTGDLFVVVPALIKALKK